MQLYACTNNPSLFHRRGAALIQAAPIATTVVQERSLEAPVQDVAALNVRTTKVEDALYKRSDGQLDVRGVASVVGDTVFKGMNNAGDVAHITEGLESVSIGRTWKRRPRQESSASAMELDDNVHQTQVSSTFQRGKRRFNDLIEDLDDDEKISECDLTNMSSEPELISPWRPSLSRWSLATRTEELKRRPWTPELAAMVKQEKKKAHDNYWALVEKLVAQTGEYVQAEKAIETIGRKIRKSKSSSMSARLSRAKLRGERSSAKKILESGHREAEKADKIADLGQTYFLALKNQRFN